MHKCTVRQVTDLQIDLTNCTFETKCRAPLTSCTVFGERSYSSLEIQNYALFALVSSELWTRSVPDGPRSEITKVEAEEVDLGLNLSLGWKLWWDSQRFALDNGTLIGISHTLKVRINFIVVRKCILCAEITLFQMQKYRT